MDPRMSAGRRPLQRSPVSFKQQPKNQAAPGVLFCPLGHILPNSAGEGRTRMFTSRECNKHRVLRDGSEHIFAFVPSSNGCKRLVAVAPQIGRRNSKRESSLWSG